MQKVAGGRSAAQTTGKQMKDESHLEEVPERRLILHPSGAPTITCRVPVVYATLRPPATFCITLRVKCDPCSLPTAHCSTLTAYCSQLTAHCSKQPDPERTDCSIPPGSRCLFDGNNSSRSRWQAQEAGERNISAGSSCRLLLPSAPDLRARREDALKRNIKIERQVRLHVVVRQATA